MAPRRRKAHDRETAYFTASQLATILQISPRWCQLDPAHLESLTGCPAEVRKVLHPNGTYVDALVWPAKGIPIAEANLDRLRSLGLWTYPDYEAPKGRTTPTGPVGAKIDKQQLDVCLPLPHQGEMKVVNL